MANRRTGFSKGEIGELMDIGTITIDPVINALDDLRLSIADILTSFASLPTMLNNMMVSQQDAAQANIDALSAMTTGLVDFAKQSEVASTMITMGLDDIIDAQTNASSAPKGGNGKKKSSSWFNYEASPVGGGAGAVGAGLKAGLAEGFTEGFPGIANFIKGLKDLKGGAAGAGAGLYSITKGLTFFAIKGVLAGAALKFAQGALEPFSSIMETIGILGEALGTGFYPVVNAINQLLLKALPFFISVGQALSSFFTAIFGGANKTEDAAGSVQSSTGTMTASIGGIISSMMPQIISFITNLVGSILNYLITNGPQILSFIMTLLTSILNLLVANAPMIFNFVMGMIPIILNLLMSQLPNLINFVVSLIPLVVSMLITNLPTILNFFWNLPLLILNEVIKGVVTLLDYFGVLPGVILNKIVSGMEQVLAYFLDLPRKFLDNLKKGWDNFVGGYSWDWGKLKFTKAS